MKKQLSPSKLQLNQLFDFANQKEWETLLWQWHKSTITGSFKKLSIKERLKIIGTYEMINQFIKNMGGKYQ